VLPVVLPQGDVDQLMSDAGQAATLTVDLERQEIVRPNGKPIHFEIEPFRRKVLLEGLDDIALTLKHGSAIDAFEARMRDTQPWLSS
jgi:3-isopropylmalate/(R)-2-methylmalate dehydratase small subunit